MSRYRVRWMGQDGKAHFGEYVDRTPFNRSYYRNVPKGTAVVEDAILPVVHHVPEHMLSDVPLDFDDNSPFNKHINDAYEEANKTSLSLGGKFGVGAMFHVCVGDGKAFYVVTKVKGTKCDVEWRGYGGGDRYTDRWLGWGRRNLPSADIRREFKGCDGLDRLFMKI